MNYIDSKENFFVQDEVAVSSTETYTQRIKADGTLEKMSIRFYPGCSKTLQIYAYIKRKGNNALEAICSMGSEAFFAGDDDKFVLDVVTPVNLDDEIYIKAINTDAVNVRNFVCSISVDYYGGLKRIIGGVL